MQALLGHLLRRKVLGLKKSPYWRRTNLDLHHVLGFYSAFVMIIITLSGVVIAFEKYTEPMFASLDANPLPAPAPAESTPIEGAKPLSVDEAVRLANAALPGAQTTSINLPAPGKASYRALMKFPEDRTPAGRSRVAIDQWSGAVLQKTSTREAGLGTSINNLKRSLHTGDVFGWPTQLIYFLASLMIAGQVITGFLIWWKPGKFARDGRQVQPGAVRLERAACLGRYRAAQVWKGVGSPLVASRHSSDSGSISTTTIPSFWRYPCRLSSREIVQDRARFAATADHLDLQFRTPGRPLGMGESISAELPTQSHR